MAQGAALSERISPDRLEVGGHSYGAPTAMAACQVLPLPSLILPHSLPDRFPDRRHGLLRLQKAPGMFRHAVLHDPAITPATKVGRWLNPPLICDPSQPPRRPAAFSSVLSICLSLGSAGGGRGHPRRPGPVHSGRQLQSEPSDLVRSSPAHSVASEMPRDHPKLP
jgi:hypothetical protein